MGSLRRVISSRSWGAAGWSFVVRAEGLEPPRLAALDPKSSVSTNFTTPANYAEASRLFTRSATLSISSLLSINPWREMRKPYMGVLEPQRARIPWRFHCYSIVKRSVADRPMELADNLPW